MKKANRNTFQLGTNVDTLLRLRGAVHCDGNFPVRRTKQLMRKLIIVVALGVCAAASFAQSNLTARVFTYDGTTTVNGNANFELDQIPANTGTLAITSNTATIDNSITAATTAGATFGVKTTVKVRTYLFVDGNFSGTFYVRGPGSGTSSVQSNDIEVRTNRPLTFLAQNFTTLNDSAVGSVDYTMVLLQNFPAGSTIATSATGTDTGFNGKTFSSAMTDLPSNGKLTFRIQRTLTLNQLALGATTYTATGEIKLTVN